MEIGQTHEGTTHHAARIHTDRVHPILFDLLFLVINSCAMGSTSTLHGDGVIGINSGQIDEWID
jgi:hypothetical protein